MVMMWFDIIPGLNFNLLSFTLIVIHYHNQKQRKIKFKPNVKLNHNRIKKTPVTFNMTGTYMYPVTSYPHSAISSLKHTTAKI